MHMAAINGNLLLVKYLVKHGGDGAVNAKDRVADLFACFFFMTLLALGFHSGDPF